MVKIHASTYAFYNMAYDWLAAVLLANQKPGLNIFVKLNGF